MGSNAEFIKANYSDPFKEENRFTLSRSNGIEAHYTKKIMAEFIQDNRVLEIGCATGYYAMHFADSCKEYVGVDLVPGNIDFLQEKIAQRGLTNVKAIVGDALNLEGIADGTFDVVCCFGPMYHLPPEERELVFGECKRVCKKSGIIAFAYINKIGVYVGACVHGGLREVSYYPNAKANKFVLEQSRDDLRSDTFFYTTPEEIEEAAKRHGLEKVKNLGTDFYITAHVIDRMPDEQFALYMPLADQMASHESCTGMSNHALLVCRKTAG